MTRFFVPGIPAPQGSKRYLGNGILVESSKRVKPWRTDVRDEARKHFDAPTTRPVLLSLSFTFARPKAHYRTGRNANLLRDGAPMHHTSRGNGDVDKLARAVLDALTGIVYLDDSQVVWLSVTRDWVDRTYGVVGLHVDVGWLR